MCQKSQAQGLAQDNYNVCVHLLIIVGFFFFGGADLFVYYIKIANTFVLLKIH